MAVTTNISVYKGEGLLITASPAAGVDEPDISGWSLAVYVSRQIELRPASDSSPLLTLTVGSGVTVTDAAAGLFQVRITASQIASLGPGTFDYDVWRTDDGSEVVLANGRLYVSPAARG